MKFTVSTNITELESNLLKNQSIFNNYFEGRDDNTDPAFIIANADVKKFRITDITAGSFSKNISELVDVSKKNISFIHVFCYNATSDPTINPDPIRFKVHLIKDTDDSYSTSSAAHSDIFLGRMSQFQLANLTELDSDIIISAPDVPIAQAANLIVVIGYK